MSEEKFQEMFGKGFDDAILKEAKKHGYGKKKGKKMEKKASSDAEEKPEGKSEEAEEKKEEKKEKKAGVNFMKYRASDIVAHLQQEYGREEKVASEKGAGWKRFEEALSKVARGK